MAASTVRLAEAAVGDYGLCREPLLRYVVFVWGLNDVSLHAPGSMAALTYGVAECQRDVLCRILFSAFQSRGQRLSAFLVSSAPLLPPSF